MKCITLTQVLCEIYMQIVLAHVLITRVLLNRSGWGLDYVVALYVVSTLMISVHCHDNMTRAMLLKSFNVLYSMFVIPAPQSGRIGPYQPCKAFGKLFTEILPCSNGFLSVLKVLLSFDLLFPRLK